MTDTITHPPRGFTIEDMPWRDPEQLPPLPEELPYDDGDKMESPWHADNVMLLKGAYITARGGTRDDYYMGGNMFVYYSDNQVKNQDFKGPDFFVVKDVDGRKKRDAWIIWYEDGRYPDVIIEMLSPSTEQNDLGAKKTLYERTFHTAEYFCVAPDVGRLLGWRLQRRVYHEIVPDERGWLWSEELGLWLGAWTGTFLGQEYTWLRFYHQDGSLVLLSEEAERQRAEAAEQRAETAEQLVQDERQRAEAAEQRARELEAEIEQLRAERGSGTGC